MELLDCGILSLSPVIKFRTEEDEVAQGLLESVLIVDPDLERQLGVSPYRRDLEPDREELFLATHLDQQFLYFVAN